MKTLKEALVKKSQRLKKPWPNPFSLTKEDAKGYLEGWPLEVITLALLETKLIRNPSYTVKDLRNIGVSGAFEWDKSKDGHEFWYKMRNKVFDDFYKVYTPEKLKERLENEIT